ncbi:hypothetical protein [Emticicia agri]|uniref:Uncharacterized protein n=1 Tax=Emticicia agri TaxID=2492393 RepID=A0A4Q5M0T0_9BACT|nr:hypothetical protein [Emticicia agri]RYU95804.1 hypothetical protein EWM59_10615 [Emticicia agri]
MDLAALLVHVTLLIDFSMKPKLIIILFLSGYVVLTIGIALFSINHRDIGRIFMVAGFAVFTICIFGLISLLYKKYFKK